MRQSEIGNGRSPNTYTSEGLRLALATMASATPGFLSMCWPTLVLNLKTLLVAVCALEYGDEPVPALLRLLDLSLPMFGGSAIIRLNSFEEQKVLEVNPETFSIARSLSVILAELVCHVSCE